METYEYLRPAMSSGMVTTGMFIAAGSVGDLEQCNPLKDMILNPTANDIYAVETDLMDADGTIGMAGLFIPEQWSMPPYIDRYGNSQIEEAIHAIKLERERWKTELNDLERDEKGIVANRTNKLPISKFPVDKKMQDKSGSVVVWERPVKNPQFGAYYASIDPVSEGKTTTSDICRAPAGALQISTLYQKVKQLHQILCVVFL